MSTPELSQNEELPPLDVNQQRTALLERQAQRREDQQRTIDAVTNASDFPRVVRDVITEARQRFPRFGLHSQGMIIDEPPAPPRLEQE